MAHLKQAPIQYRPGPLVGWLAERSASWRVSENEAARRLAALSACRFGVGEYHCWSSWRSASTSVGAALNLRSPVARHATARTVQIEHAESWAGRRLTGSEAAHFLARHGLPMLRRSRTVLALAKHSKRAPAVEWSIT